MYNTVFYNPAKIKHISLKRCTISFELQVYLTDEEFKQVFSMSKSDFYRMPGWKQQKQKKEVLLF